MLIQLAFSLSFVMFPLAAEAGTSLVDSSGNFNFQIPSLSTSSGIVGIISSPGTPSNLVSSDDDDGSYLSLMDNEKAILSCRGATMSAGSAGERLSLCTTSMVSGAIVLEGVTEGDVEAGLSNSRHARTLTALFRARRLVDNQQALLIGYMGSVTEEVSKVIKEEIERIFDAVAAEVEGAKSFSELYELQVASLQVTGDGQDVSVFLPQTILVAYVIYTGLTHCFHFLHRYYLLPSRQPSLAHPIQLWPAFCQKRRINFASQE
jgi:hypothetical protein